MSAAIWAHHVCQRNLRVLLLVTTLIFPWTEVKGFVGLTVLPTTLRKQGTRVFQKRTRSAWAPKSGVNPNLLSPRQQQQQRQHRGTATNDQRTENGTSRPTQSASSDSNDGRQVLMQGRFLCPIATMSRRQAIASALLGVTGGAVCLGQAASSSGLPMVEGESSGLALPTQLESGQWMTNVPAKQDSERGVPLALPPVGARAKRLFLARHGQTDFNALMICQGRRLNPPLNKVGREQAGHLAAQVAVSAIFCSPLVRAHETAGIVQASNPTAIFSVSEDLNEVDFGRAEGLPQLLAAACLAPTYVAWSKGQDVERAGGGENLAEIQQRAVTAAATLLRACDEGGQVLGVSHSSMLKITLATLLDVPLNMIRSLGQDNCAINALDYDTVSGSFEAVLVNNNIYRGRGAAFSAATHAAVTS